MASLSTDLQHDLDSVGKITVIPSILESICKSTGMGFAAIARVTDQKWIACAVRDDIHFGLLPGGELLLESTICNEIRETGEKVIIEQVSLDERFASHHTPALYGFQSYISVPLLRKDGSFFGTLCALDTQPAQISKPEVVNMFLLYADLISFHLNAVEQVSAAQRQLKEEQETSASRDSFIAILGHDLRNPLGAISNSAQLLLRMPLDDRMRRLTGIIRDSSKRMNGLIENVLDFARGRFGEGLTITPREEDMEQVIRQVVTELQSVWPDRVIEEEIHIEEPMFCDGRRIAQLLSNLLGNALSHSPAGTPVKLTAAVRHGVFHFRVSNQGADIPLARREKLFQPFNKGEQTDPRKGLGLGLYIAAEIAKAHGGTLDVESENGEISFYLTFSCR